MKKIILFIGISYCLLFNTIKAQNWYENYVSPGFNTPNLNAVYLYDFYTGLCCGNGGYIANWIEFVGDAWNPVANQITTKNLNSIIMVDSFSVHKSYCVGEGGKILKSNNILPWSGGVFYMMNSPTTKSLNSVYFTDYIAGIAVGDTGTVIKTTDGGSHWNVIAPVTTNSLYSVNFPVSGIGYAVGENGIVLKTTNNGTNWAIKTAPLADTLRCVWFTDTNTGFVVSRNGSIYKTTNGGDNWQSKTSNTTQHLNAIRFSTSLNGYAAGNNNMVVKTTNGGETWSVVSMPLFIYHTGNFRGLGIDNSGSFIAAVGTNGTAASTHGDGGSIKVTQKESNVLFYPDPVKDKLTIKTKDHAIFTRLIIYNTAGIDVYQLNMNMAQEECNIDLGNLPAGLYMIIVIGANGKPCYDKFVKQ